MATSSVIEPLEASPQLPAITLEHLAAADEAMGGSKRQRVEVGTHSQKNDEVLSHILDFGAWQAKTQFSHAQTRQTTMHGYMHRHNPYHTSATFVHVVQQLHQRLQREIYIYGPS